MTRLHWVENVEYITLDDIRKQLGISKSTAYRLIHSGELRYVRVGRRMKIAVHDYQAWLRRKSVGGEVE